MTDRGRPINLHVIVSWKGKQVYYDDVKECSRDLNISVVSILNYVYGTTLPKYGMVFRKPTPEEKLLHEALKIETDEKDAETK